MEVVEEAARRRTFAIVSHPDAGKTTTTEKLLLYAGAVEQAGSVDARQGRKSATSDWMEFERRRGISITAAAMSFEHGGRALNLLDTPGHHDFSEDTVRVMAAADCAVVVLDGTRGIETQTARVLDVARRRGLPMLFFVNKIDRPALEPLELVDRIEAAAGLAAAPLNWPVGDPGELRGLVDLEDRALRRFRRSARGATQAEEEVVPPARARREEGELFGRAEEEIGLLDSSGLVADSDAFRRGRQALVVFGSAGWNVGVGDLLAAIAELSPPPSPRLDREGEVRDLDSPFSGFVFKVQANMDPRHRDNLAFIRVCSGRFQRGMTVTSARTGRSFALNYPHALFGRERAILDVAWPGDVIGVVNASQLQVGDSIFVDEPVSYPPLPRLSPSRFALARNRDAQRYRQFSRGLEQLDGEGLIQVVRRHRDDPQAVLAGMGELQFEAVAERMRHEFGVELALEPLALATALPLDPALEEAVRRAPRAEVFLRAGGGLLAAFRTEYDLGAFLRDRSAEISDEEGERTLVAAGA